MHEVRVKNILSNINGMNIYRGCSHGCIYCDSRSTCYQMAHAFEDIEIKINAPELLEMALKRKRQRCMIGTGSMSDPYMHIEKQYGLTRRCLKVISRYGFGATVLTKSDLVLRDLDLLCEINERSRAVVQMTLTTMNEQICKIVEPHVATTRRRLEVLNIMKEKGIPTVVWFTPVLPYINDTEENVLGIVRECAKAGVWGIITFGLGLTLREGDREYYYQKLDEHFPGLKDRYIREFGESYVVPIRNHERLYKLFLDECQKYGIETNEEKIFAFLNKFEDKAESEQLSLL